jgi:hypothetical protein
MPSKLEVIQVIINIPKVLCTYGPIYLLKANKQISPVER